MRPENHATHSRHAGSRTRTSGRLLAGLLGLFSAAPAASAQAGLDPAAQTGPSLEQASLPAIFPLLQTEADSSRTAADRPDSLKTSQAVPPLPVDTATLSRLLVEGLKSREIRKGLRMYGEAIVPQLCDIALSSSDTTAAKEAADLLRSKDKAGALRVAVKMFEEPQRYMALLNWARRVLSSSDTEESIAILKKTFLDPSFPVRIRESIGHDSDIRFSPQERQALFDILKDDQNPEDLRCGALTQLHQSNLTSADVRACALALAAQDSSTELRGYAIQTLIELPFADVLSGLQELIRQPYLQAPEFSEDFELLLDGLIMNGQAQGQHDEIIKSLAAAARDGSFTESARVAAINCLSFAPDPMVPAFLSSILDNPLSPQKVKMSAILGLTRRDPPAALVYLQKILESQFKGQDREEFLDLLRESIRCAGGLHQSLARIADEQAQRRVLILLGENADRLDVSEHYDSILEAAILLLEHDPGQAINAFRRLFFESKPGSAELLLRESLEDKFTYDQRLLQATKLLAACEEPGAQEIVCRLAESDDQAARLFAARALAERDPQFSREILEQIEPSYGLPVELLVDALIEADSPRTRQAALELIFDDYDSWDEDAAMIVGRALDTPDKILEFAGNVESCADRADSLGGTQELRDYASALRKCPELGIESPLRLNHLTLIEAVRNRLGHSADSDKRPLALVVFPRNDDNLAFYRVSDALSELIIHGYRLMYFEAGSEKDVINALKTGTSLNGQERARPAKLIILGAHGFKKGMSFGAEDPQYVGISDESRFIDIGDESELLEAGISRALLPGGKVVTHSCSTGAGRDEQPDNANISNMFRRIFPQAAPGGIISPIAPASFKELEFDENNELREAHFSSPVYHSRLDQSQVPENQSFLDPQLDQA